MNMQLQCMPGAFLTHIQVAMHGDCKYFIVKKNRTAWLMQIKCKKNTMHYINAVQCHLSENYLMRKIIAQNIWS